MHLGKSTTSLSFWVSQEASPQSSLTKDDVLELLLLAALLAHAPEDAAVLLPQLLGAAVLGDGAVAEDQDAVKVGNCAQAVGDDDERRVVELLADGPLNQRVGRHVDGRRRLVEDHDLGPRDDGAREAEQLALALREVPAALGDGGVEAAEDVGVLLRRVERGRLAGVVGGGGAGRLAGRRRARLHQVHALQRVAEIGVGLVVKGVKVGAHGAGEEDGVLRDDGEAGAQLVELDLGDVEAVDVDASRAGLEEAEEGEGQRGLAGARAADDADALVPVDAKGQALEDGREVLGVADHKVLDLQTALGGPRRGGLDAALVFGLEVRVLDDALCGVHVELNVGVVADGPDDGLRELEREGEGETGERGVHGGAAEDDEADGRGEQGTDEGHAPAHPAVEQPQVPGGHAVVVKAGVHGVDVDLGLVSAADGHHADERGAEEVEDGRLGRALKALGGSGAGEDTGQRNDERGDVEGGDADSEDAEDGTEDAREIHTEAVVNDVEVRGEAVEDSAGGDGVEPAERGAEDGAGDALEHAATGLVAHDEEVEEATGAEDGGEGGDADVNTQVEQSVLVHGDVDGAGRYVEFAMLESEGDATISVELSDFGSLNVRCLLRVDSSSILISSLLGGLLVALDQLQRSILGKLGHETRVLDCAVAELNEELGLGLAERNVVGDQNAGSALAKLASKALLVNVAADVGVDGAEDVVEDEDAGARVNGPGEGETPLLTTAEVDTVGSQLGLVAVGEHFQILLEGADLDGFVVALLVKGKTEEDVALQGSVLNPGDLADERDAAGDDPVATVGLVVVPLVDRGRLGCVDLAGQEIGLSENSCQQQTLACASLARNDGQLTSGEGDVDVAQNEPVLLLGFLVNGPGDGGVLESDIGTIRDGLGLLGSVQVVLNSLHGDVGVDDVGDELGDDGQGDLEVLEDTDTDKSNRRDQGAVDEGINGEGDSGQDDRTGDPHAKKHSRAKLLLAHVENSLLPLGLKRGELDLAHTHKSLVHNGKLLVTDLHQLVLRLGVDLGVREVDGEKDAPREKSGTEGTPAEQVDEKPDGNDQLGSAGGEKELEGREVRDALGVNAEQVDDGLLRLEDAVVLGLFLFVVLGLLVVLSVGLFLLRLGFLLGGCLDVLPAHGLLKDKSRQGAAEGDAQLGPRQPEHGRLSPSVGQDGEAEPEYQDPDVEGELVAGVSTLEGLEDLQSDPRRGEAQECLGDGDGPLHEQRHTVGPDDGPPQVQVGLEVVRLPRRSRVLRSGPMVGLREVGRIEILLLGGQINDLATPAPSKAGVSGYRPEAVHDLAFKVDIRSSGQSNAGYHKAEGKD
ncbi:uncharacterized protein ColSpa_01929 [Colletotrichum spaethianum]|uniref:Uncharacterized protein n=1 Tax=Colletotrichum spaethianum TaxID=700344 RepID=A0AA37L8R4_9PEZI|nr:uncharacterized protein ColSpa_01929 [Colletotrichum spaethianum]GKT41748.1 hypothetical protein ColSpa_01929 [Colletotrichum spaethianum]